MTELTIKRPTLVNFRASPNQLASFDRVCAVSGKTRTQVLIEMMQQHVANASAAISETNIKETAAEKIAKIDLKPFSRSIDRGASRAPLDTTNLVKMHQIQRSKTFWDRMMSKMNGGKR